MTAAPARWPELGLHLLRDRRFLWMIINIVRRIMAVTSTVIDFWMIMRVMGTWIGIWGYKFLSQTEGFSQMIKGNFKEGRRWVGWG